MEKPELCQYGCGNIGKYKFKTGWSCSRVAVQCPVMREKMRKIRKKQHKQKKQEK